MTLFADPFQSLNYSTVVAGSPFAPFTPPLCPDLCKQTCLKSTLLILAAPRV